MRWGFIRGMTLTTDWLKNSSGMAMKKRENKRYVQCACENKKRRRMRVRRL